MGLLVILMVWHQRGRGGVEVLLLPLIFFCIVLTALGVGTLLAALNVAYRDFRYMMPFLLQLWMFATPSIYTDAEAVPAGARAPVGRGRC